MKITMTMTGAPTREITALVGSLQNGESLRTMPPYHVTQMHVQHYWAPSIMMACVAQRGHAAPAVGEIVGAGHVQLTKSANTALRALTLRCATMDNA